MPKKRCYVCQAPASYRGTFHTFGASPKPRNFVRSLCCRHYLEADFGLWAFRCTKRCGAQVARKTLVVLSPEDLVVWLRIKVAIDLPRPKCPWCGNSMRRC